MLYAKFQDLQASRLQVFAIHRCGDLAPWSCDPHCLYKLSDCMKWKSILYKLYSAVSVFTTKILKAGASNPRGQIHTAGLIKLFICRSFTKLSLNFILYIFFMIFLYITAYGTQVFIAINKVKVNKGHHLCKLCRHHHQWFKGKFQDHWTSCSEDF